MKKVYYVTCPNNYVERKGATKRPKFIIAPLAVLLLVIILPVLTRAISTATNLMLDAGSGFVRLDGDLVAFGVSESSQANTDLNGDGDTDDLVLHVFNAATTTMTNLMLDANFGFVRLDGNLVAFVVSESNQGNTDLNGDGDTDDVVLHVFNAATTTTTNLMLDGSFGFELNGNLVAFGVDEFSQGNTDLNGDGDTDDVILHVFNAATATTTNLMLDTGGFQLDGNGNLVAFSVFEFDQGNTDLNGDGDTDDFVLHVFNAATTTTTNLMLDDSLGPRLDGNLVAFGVSESSQGNTDLNGDGDAFDVVLHVFNAATTTTTNLMLDANDGFGFGLQLDGDLVAFVVSEFDQGNTDLNGDGDADDFVLHVFNAATTTTTNLMLDANFGFELDGNLVAFGVSESSQGNTDLNGDGDTDDFVLHVFNVSTATTTNVMIDASGFFGLDGNLVAFLVFEFQQGDTDLNGDGDADDLVLHVFNAATTTTTNLMLAPGAGGEFQLDGNLVAFGVSEFEQGNTDLNGDGDTDDFVLHVFNADTATTTNLMLDANDGFDIGIQLDENLVAFVVSESSQGNTDLNGDGDTDDDVVHVFNASIQDSNGGCS